MEGAIRAAFSGCSACRIATAAGRVDRDNDHISSATFLSPDHNAMIDPSTADVTRAWWNASAGGWPR